MMNNTPIEIRSVKVLRRVFSQTKEKDPKPAMVARAPVRISYRDAVAAPAPAPAPAQASDSSP